MRTQEEIVARIHALKEVELFGFGRGVLLGYLDFEHAQPFLAEFKGPTTAAQWEEEYPADKRTEEHALVEARDYNDFAWEKVSDHRSNSAMRNIDKMRAWAWLLGKDDVLTQAEEAQYEPYGAPQLRILCEGMGLRVPVDPAIHNMVEGRSCRPDCGWGCGR
jgi:hypothetical protein